MSPKKPPTPEGLSLRAIQDWLKAARIGTVHRVNVGQLRVGEAPKHPWAKDARRIVRFGEPGAADLHIELNVNDLRIPAQFRGRDLHIEVKHDAWKPPCVPKVGSAPGTVKKYRHHVDQVAFLDRQVSRGNLGTFARTPREVYDYLRAAGFLSLPVPEEPRKAPAVSRAGAGVRTKPSARETGSQK